MRQSWKKIVSYAMVGLLGVGMLGQVNVISVNAEVYSPERQAQIDEVQKDKKIPGTVKTEGKFDSSYLSLSGYAGAAKYGVGDRSQYKEGDPEYAVVKTPKEFFDALQGARGNAVKVIEIGADLDLGWFALTEEERKCNGIEVYTGNGYTALNTTGCSFTNPDLMKSGISILEISGITGLTIFSKEGYSIEHAEIKLQEGCSDIVIRNLRFGGMWEWDDWMKNSYGGNGGHKRTGWSTFKINGADRVWLDHCDFGIAFDGCLDISGTQPGQGCEGISVTWCTFGKESMEQGSMLYNTMEYLESIYQESKVNPNVNSFTIYGILRDSGWTKEECIQYGAFHAKCHLTGDGDKDYDKNPLTRYTLAFNQYYNIQSRVPLVRQGSVHMYNCYLDYMSRYSRTDCLSDPANGVDGQSISGAISQAGGNTWSLFRAMEARNGASVAADTCVYYGVKGPLVGSEKQEGFGYNHGLIVNSSVTKWDSSKKQPGDAYVGSSWDYDGNNPFLERQDYWKDKSTIGNWTWKELAPTDAANKTEYDQYIDKKDATLPYSYRTIPLETVKETLVANGGAGVLDMTAEEWLETSYDSTYQIRYKADKTAEVESVSLDEESTTLAMGERLQLYAVTAPEDAKTTKITWTSSNETIASVLSSGLVEPLKPGTVTITATTENGKSVSCEVQVINLPSKVTIVGFPRNIYVGDVYKVEADMEPLVIDESIMVESSDEQIATITNGNVFTAIGEGYIDLVATANLTGKMIWNQMPKTGSKTVEIKACPVPVTGVALDVTSVALSTEVSGESVTLSASLFPANPTNSRINWSSSDETVATVVDGVVTPVSTGTAVITVTTVNGAKSAECEVKVNGGVQEPDPEPNPSEVTMGDVNGDGLIDTDDALEVLKYALGMDVVHGFIEEAAYVTDDDVIDTDDALEILKYALGMDSVLKKEDDKE